MDQGDMDMSQWQWPHTNVAATVPVSALNTVNQVANPQSLCVASTKLFNVSYIVCGYSRSACMGVLIKAIPWYLR